MILLSEAFQYKSHIRDIILNSKMVKFYNLLSAFNFNWRDTTNNKYIIEKQLETYNTNIFLDITKIYYAIQQIVSPEVFSSFIYYSNPISILYNITQYLKNPKSKYIGSEEHITRYILDINKYSKQLQIDILKAINNTYYNAKLTLQKIPFYNEYINMSSLLDSAFTEFKYFDINDIVKTADYTGYIAINSDNELVGFSTENVKMLLKHFYINETVVQNYDDYVKYFTKLNKLETITIINGIEVKWLTEITTIYNECSKIILRDHDFLNVCTDITNTVDNNTSVWKYYLYNRYTIINTPAILHKKKKLSKVYPFEDSKIADKFNHITDKESLLFYYNHNYDLDTYYGNFLNNVNDKTSNLIYTQIYHILYEISSNKLCIPENISKNNIDFNIVKKINLTKSLLIKIRDIYNSLENINTSIYNSYIAVNNKLIGFEITDNMVKKYKSQLNNILKQLNIILSQLKKLLVL